VFISLFFCRKDGFYGFWRRYEEGSAGRYRCYGCNRGFRQRYRRGSCKERGEQGKVVNEELKHKAKQKLKDHVTVNVVKDYGDLIDAVDDMSEEDLDRLMDRIEAKKQASENTPEDTPEESKEDEQ